MPFIFESLCFPYSNQVNPDVKDLLKPVMYTDGQINAADLKRAMELLEIEKSLGATSADANKALHWDPNRAKPGLGEVLYKANLMVRRTVYGDVCQNEDEDGLRLALLYSGNCVSGAIDII